MWLSRATLKQTDGVEISKDYLWGTQTVPKTAACLCSGGVTGKLIQKVSSQCVISGGLRRSMKLSRAFWEDLKKILPNHTKL